MNQWKVIGCVSLAIAWVYFLRLVVLATRYVLNVRTLGMLFAFILSIYLGTGVTHCPTTTQRTLSSRHKTPIAEASLLKKECCVCMDQLASHASIKCGHQCMCPSCAAHLKRCPVCRVPFNAQSDLLRIFSA